MIRDVNAAQVPHTILQVDSQHAVWIAGAGCVRHEVIGEEYHHQHMQRVAASVQGRGDVPVAAWLVPEAGSVAVWTMGSKVGFLPPPMAAIWLPALQSLAARHNLPVACQATLDAPSASNNGVLGMALWLPALGPAVSPPAPSAPLVQPAASRPDGSDLVRVQLYKEVAALQAELERTKQAFATANAQAHAATAASLELAQAREDLRRLGSESDLLRADLSKKHVSEVTALRAELEGTKQALAAAIAEARPVAELAQIREELGRLGSEVEARRGELRSVEEALEVQSFGFYEPKYGFDSSAQYTARLKGIREEQQRLIKDDMAAPCDGGRQRRRRQEDGAAAGEGHVARLQRRVRRRDREGALRQRRHHGAAAAEGV